MKDQQLGKWTLVTLIDDSGGNGVVWHARNSTGEDVALKVLRQFDSEPKSEKRRKRFLNEITSLKFIEQREIPRVMLLLDHGFTDDGQPWYAMPLAEPINLPKGDASVVIEVMIEVSDTIARLHEIGMEHRDIKPSNLLMLNGNIVVSDFGLARMIGDEHFTRTGERVGSVGYTANECVGKSDNPRFECDVYALGKTAWVLFTRNERPPNGELRSPNDDLANYDIDFGSLSVSAIQELVFAATERDPGDRPTARQFCDGLKLVMSNEKPSNPNSTGSAAARARSLFGDQAAKNRREREANDLFLLVCRDATRRWVSMWAETIENLGWPTSQCSGGNMGYHATQLSDGWRAGQRNFFRGSIDNTDFEIALTFRKKSLAGEARLVFGFTFAVQISFGSRPQIKAEDCEHVIASAEFDTFLKGPQLESTKERLFAMVGDQEFVFRALEKMKTLVDAPL